MTASKGKSRKTKANLRNQHADGKRSVGLKSSLLKKRISKKAMSAKTSVKKLVSKTRTGKQSVKWNSKKKRQYQKALEFNLKYATKNKSKKTKSSRGKGYMTPSKPKLSGFPTDAIDLEDGKSYLGHTAQSKNRAMSRFAEKNPVKIVKKIKKGPTGKKKLIEPKVFKLRSDARCAERRRLREQREKRRLERELLRK
jgi:hypothetical protein